MPSKIFLSETTQPMKLYNGVKYSCMVLYQFYIFGADLKSKMATTAGQSLTFEPMGNTFRVFLSETTQMMKLYYVWKILVWSSTKITVCFWCRSEIQDGIHRRTKFNIGPYGKYLQRSSCQKLHDRRNYIMAWKILVWSSAKIMFLVQIRSPRWLPPRDKD